MLETLPPMLLASCAILIGFAGLVWSADRFVFGSAAIAKSLGVAPLIIGLTIVSFGTSAPEVMVSLNASLSGAGDLAIGNAIGSNIANIGLVLGVTTLLAAIPVQKHLLRDELPVLLVVTAVSGLFLFDNNLARWECIVLMVMLIPAVAYLVITKQRGLTPAEIEKESVIVETRTLVAVFWFIIGLIALVISSKALVWGATTTAVHFGVSPLVIGLTVIAIGTSLPELAASAMSAIKGHHDIALGNIIGSNMFNLLAVMSIPGIIEPLSLDPSVFARDFGVMLGLTLLLTAVIWWVLRKPDTAKISKGTGLILLCAYVAYYVKLFLDA